MAKTGHFFLFAYYINVDIFISFRLDEFLYNILLFASETTAAEREETLSFRSIFEI